MQNTPKYERYFGNILVCPVGETGGDRCPTVSCCCSACAPDEMCIKEHHPFPEDSCTSNDDCVDEAFVQGVKFLACCPAGTVQNKEGGASEVYPGFCAAVCPLVTPEPSAPPSSPLSFSPPVPECPKGCEPMDRRRLLFSTTPTTVCPAMCVSV